MNALAIALLDRDFDAALPHFHELPLGDQLYLLNNETRILWLAELAAEGLLGPADAVQVCQAIASGHELRSLWEPLQLVLEATGFATDDQERFDALPQMVTVYRGERGDWQQQPWAPSWTLSLEVAGRFGGDLRTALIDKRDVLAAVFCRDELELIIGEIL